MKKKAVLLAGEKSGDLIGGEVCRELTKLNVEIFGVGGDSMLSNGLKESFFDMAEISLMGFLEVLPKVFAVKKRINETVENILKLNPDFVLTIDSPGFNTRVVKKLKGKFKGKIYHAVAPTVWVYKEGRAKLFAHLYYRLFCILPFEPPYFVKEGLPADFICYPPLARLQDAINDTKNFDKKYIIFFIGSRRGELVKHLDFAKEVVKLIKTKIPEALFVFPTLLHLKDDIVKAFPDEIVATEEDKKIQFLKEAKFSISKSGTGAVEASLFEIPSVVFYKANTISFWILKAISKFKFANIINILLDREVIPEFIQNNATPQNVANKTIELLQNKEECLKQIEGVLEAKNLLSSKNYKSFGEGVVFKIMQDL
jgi:lipid-A-disaccharide synthase